MVLKVVDATELRVGTNIIIDGDAHTVKKMDVSKTGKHGHAKVRMEATSIKTGKKKVLVVPGHDKFDIPMVDKRRAQVLSVNGDMANMMDSESFENLDLVISEELKDDISEGKDVEYWDIEGEKLLMKAL